MRVEKGCQILGLKDGEKQEGGEQVGEVGVRENPQGHLSASTFL